MEQFTSTIKGHKSDASVGCHGMNHSDFGYKAICDNCGASVVRWVDGNDKVKWHTNAGDQHYCFNNRHECDPAAVEFHQRKMECYIRKGIEVRVIRGRKVPKGTTGKVFWVALEADEWGVKKAGFVTESGEKIFINHAYLEIIR
jgi:hypothetical protein